LNKLGIVKIILTILCTLAFIIGIFSVFQIYVGGTDAISMVANWFMAQIGEFLLFIVISATIILLKLTGKRNHPKIYFTIMIVGFIIAGLNSGPLLLTPVSISHANNEFNAAFGENWETTIADDVKSYFMPSPFNIPQLFLGVPHKECQIIEDILYYEDPDEEVTLFFDVYMPKEFDENLPGNRNTIIKIHGGAWVGGDKSAGNMPVVNKYLAAQGYVVFDIQYGLRETGSLGAMGIITPENVIGNYTFIDMINQIGIFTKLLENNYSIEYSANLESVYIMGNSAGGHLTSVTGFGYNEDYFNGTFSENLNIKGVIPLYPPSDVSWAGARGFLPGNPETDPELFDAYSPTALIDPNDPPCLIYQGTGDKLVPFSNSIEIETACDNAGVISCNLLFPLAGHASDIFFSTNFGQIWLYYLERFLYLTH